MAAGHFCPSGRYESIRELAFDIAFLLRYGGFMEDLPTLGQVFSH